MFIRITRLLLIFIISIFLGMCFVWLFMYIAKGESTLMLNIAISGSIILIVAIIILQLWENHRHKKEKEKILKEQEELKKD